MNSADPDQLQLQGPDCPLISLSEVEPSVQPYSTHSPDFSQDKLSYSGGHVDTSRGQGHDSVLPSRSKRKIRDEEFRLIFRNAFPFLMFK